MQLTLFKLLTKMAICWFSTSLKAGEWLGHAMPEEPFSISCSLTGDIAQYPAPLLTRIKASLSTTAP